MKVYLNHAGVGLISPRQHAMVRKFLDDYLQIGPPELLEYYEQYIPALHKELAAFLNCSEDEVVFIKNTTEGINIAASTLPLQSGDEVILLENEYAANRLPWFAQRANGVLITTIPGMDSIQSYATLLSTIGPKTRAIAISLVQYYDGYIFDLNSLAKLCRERNIFLIVDAVQAAGTRVIDLQEIPVDILISGGQKHIGAIQGTGFMYVNRTILPQLAHGRVGIRSMQRFTDTDYELKQTAARFEDGTVTLIGVISLYEAIRKLNILNIKKIEKKNLQLLADLKAKLRANNISFIDHEPQGNLVSLKVQDPRNLYEFLRNNKIYTKVVKDVLRLSFHYKNTPQEFAEVVAKIKEWEKRSARTALPVESFSKA